MATQIIITYLEYELDADRIIDVEYNAHAKEELALIRRIAYKHLAKLGKTLRQIRTTGFDKCFTI